MNMKLEQIGVARNKAETIKQEYLSYLDKNDFVCVAAKAALAKQQIHCFVAGHIACPNDDGSILNFLYKFVDEYRSSNELYHSAAVIFQGPEFINAQMFETFMWHRLQALSDLDAVNYNYDNRVDQDTSSSNFSFSLKKESMFIIGLHPASSRPARSFKYPALVFNPHMQFEQLRGSGKYDKMKYAVRKRDIALSGSINPMLKDFGDASEVYQYSGRQYDKAWQCPLKINHAVEHNTTP